jgi:hypothetical protein
MTRTLNDYPTKPAFARTRDNQSTHSRAPSSPDLVDLVGAMGGTWHGNTAMCPCPAHADAHADAEPSLSLRQRDHGILVTCFAGSSRREDVLRELGRIKSGQHYPAPPTTSGV